jgi:predicted NBD/HSP70 family sugar kinase
MYLLFDIGGTKARFAFSSDGISFREPKICSTLTDFSEAMALFKKTALEVLGGQKIIAAAGGVRALDRDKKKLRDQPHFPLWVNEPLQETLQDFLGVPVYLENDTAIVGLGEAVQGAGKGYDIVVYITISTGVGGVRVTRQRIDESAQGFEPGNQLIYAKGSIYEDEKPGYLESYISGTAIEKRFGKKPYEIKEPAIWDEVARLLAYGLTNTIVHWSPDIVVLGGAMITGQSAISLDSVQAHLRDMVKVYPDLPEVKKAQLGDVGGLHGALAFVNQVHNKQ